MSVGWCDSGVEQNLLVIPSRDRTISIQLPPNHNASRALSSRDRREGEHLEKGRSTAGADRPGSSTPLPPLLETLV